MESTASLLLNRQLVTRWDRSRRRLITALEDRPVPKLSSGEILVEVLAVPVHGSFWLATHPGALHPRREEFLREGYFVFGNGGVGRVVALSRGIRGVERGDYVCIFGHYPCAHGDCLPCRRHRYVECAYGEGKILGHGKGARDGTFARYAVLPAYSWEACFRQRDHPSPRQLLPFMFGFLVADVRNALTRLTPREPRERAIIVGAGRSGHLAAALLVRENPRIKILAVDVNAERLRSFCSIRPGQADGVVVPSSVAISGGRGTSGRAPGAMIEGIVKKIGARARRHFAGRKCDLLMDCSSVDSARLWANAEILSPGVECLLFGFGIRNLCLPKEILQMSGLAIRISRGVGDLDNRRRSIEYIRGPGAGFIARYLIGAARRFRTLEEFAAFVRSRHDSARSLVEGGDAYVTPNVIR